MRLTVVWSDKDRVQGFRGNLWAAPWETVWSGAEKAFGLNWQAVAGYEAICALAGLALATEMCVRGRCRQIRDAPWCSGNCYCLMWASQTLSASYAMAAFANEQRKEHTGKQRSWVWPQVFHILPLSTQFLDLLTFNTVSLFTLLPIHSTQPTSGPCTSWSLPGTLCHQTLLDSPI